MVKRNTSSHFSNVEISACGAEAGEVSAARG